MIDLVGERFSEHPQHKHVALFELDDVGKQLGGWQSAVAGNNAVRTGPSDWEGRPFDVADVLLQQILVGSMEDRQVDADGRNHDRAHQSVLIDVESAFVALMHRSGRKVPVAFLEQILVVFLRVREHQLQIELVHLRDRLVIRRHGAGRVHIVPPVRHRRIQQQGQPYRESHNKQNCRPILF